MRSFAAAAGVLLAWLPAAAVGGGAPAATTQVAAQFVRFAGSPANADALVGALRTGVATSLAIPTTGQEIAFAPAGGAIGYGNAFVALSLAQQAFLRAGVARPTPVQIVAALNGGGAATMGPLASMPGILQLRASGAGWGQIANRLGVSIEAAVRAWRPIERRLAGAGVRLNASDRLQYPANSPAWTPANANPPAPGTVPLNSDYGPPNTAPGSAGARSWSGGAPSPARPDGG
ncbi:MAG: hypothetical protein ACREFX_02895 [Opitutaceae bacterium]